MNTPVSRSSSFEEISLSNDTVSVQMPNNLNMTPINSISLTTKKVYLAVSILNLPLVIVTGILANDTINQKNNGSLIAAISLLGAYSAGYLIYNIIFNRSINTEELPNRVVNTTSSKKKSHFISNCVKPIFDGLAIAFYCYSQTQNLKPLYFTALIESALVTVAFFIANGIFVSSLRTTNN